MIFVTVGSQKFQFDRLLKAVDELVENGSITEEVFAQSGACTYIPKHYESKPFLDREEFREIMEKSDIVITHGGTGAIIGAVKAGKKVIAVPRLAKYGEHVDDHQLQLIEQFSENHLTMSCNDLNDLGAVYKSAKISTFSHYKSNTGAFLTAISGYIEGDFV